MALESLKSQVSLIGSMKVQCLSRGHSFYLDLKEKEGGNDEGMCPGEALLSALGGCKCIVAQNVAKQMNIKFSNLTIELEAEYDPKG